MAKLSLAAVVLVALVGLGVMAAVGGDVTGAFSAPKPPKMAKPAPKLPVGAPIRPPVTRDITVVEEQPEYVVYDDYTDYDARILAAQCWQINYVLDRDAGRNTPPSQISTACPAWV